MYTLKIRSVPAQVEPVEGIGGFVSLTELKSVLIRLFPCWEIFKLSRAIHALRLWGPDAVFDSDRYRMPYPARVYTGRELFGLLLDHRHFSKIVRTVEPLLTSTDMGVAVEAKSYSLRMEGDLGHTDTLLTVCAELGIARDVFIRTVNGESTVGRMVDAAVATFDPGQEMEWTIEALARYLAPSSGWTNRFGENYSFGQVVEKLVKRGGGEGSCLGTHVPYAIAILLRLDERHDILGRAPRASAIKYLQVVSRTLEQGQASNGTWPSRWTPGVPDDYIPDTDEARTLVGLTLMGHHMEWIAFAPEEVRPRKDCLMKALKFMTEHTPAMADGAVQEYYHLLTHVGNALCHYAGVIPSSAYKLFL